MKVVQKSLGSIDGVGLMLGTPAYTDDLADPSSLVLKVLRSPHAFAKILEIDTTKAEAITGVACVLTYKDFKRISYTRAGQGYPEPSPHDKFVLDKVVRYVGDEVAVVAAVDEKTAIEALGAIDVTYEVMTPVLDFEQAYEHPSIIHDEPEAHEMFPIGFEPKKNVAAAYHMEIGDVDKVLESCDVVIEDTYYTQAQAHAMMEPHTVNTRIDFQGRIVLYSSTQTPVHVRRIISQGLDIPISKIRVIKPRVGGGYGGKQCVHGELLAVACTLKTKKPCQLVYSRKEVFESTYTRHAMRLKIRLGADLSGHLKAIDCQVLSDTGAYGEHALTVFMIVGAKVLPLYNRVDAVRFGGQVVYTNHVSAGAFRGYGAIQGNFAIESAMDQLAKKLNIDPTVLREMNMIKPGETSPIFEKMGEGTEGTPMTIESCELAMCIKRGKELIGWDEKFHKVQTGKVRRGVGMAIAMQGSGIANIDMASATLKLNDDGFFNLLVGATDIGQGSDTVLAQIAAETLGITLDKVIVYSSDTDITPFDTGAYASSTTYVSGNAVIKAAVKMREAIDEARHLFADGASMTLSELSNKITYNEHQQQLMVTASYVGEQSPPPYMAGFAEVEVDTETGEVKVLNYVAVVDCGVAINPHLARTQVEGGLVQGIGMALYEDVHYSDKGQLTSNELMYYYIPTRQEIHQLNVELVKSYETTGPYGAKSVGEIGIDTPPAAIANAIAHATGARIHTLPMTSERVYQHLQGE